MVEGTWSGGVAGVMETFGRGVCAVGRPAHNGVLE
jgi:hypothetical protein